jgi:exodeoxyribonuclease V alpha subunit
LENAIKINCGKQNLVYDNSFSFVAAHDDEEAAKKIMKLFDVEWRLQGKNVNAVQVLTPLREDTKVSANALNLKIKDRINPYQRGQQEIKNGNKIFRIQDKVMQTKNEDEISNGDIGIVRKIGKMSGKKYMEVDFGEERVMRYQEGESWNLVHAYAITAHKGQGSEYPVVIIPILSCFRRHTLKRNLYYTAITRAKRKVILVGSKQAFSQAIRAGRSKKRNTLLSYRLKKAFTEVSDKNEAA